MADGGGLFVIQAAIIIVFLRVKVFFYQFYGDNDPFNYFIWFLGAVCAAFPKTIRSFLAFVDI